MPTSRTDHNPKPTQLSVQETSLHSLLYSFPNHEQTHNELFLLFKDENSRITRSRVSDLLRNLELKGFVKRGNVRGSWIALKPKETV